MSVKSDEALERIALALEGINDSLSGIQQSLEVLEEVSECVSQNQYGSMFCITGNITAYEP